MSELPVDGYDWKPIRPKESEQAIWVLVTEKEWESYLALSPFDCTHPTSELRVQPIKGGRNQWKKQCLTCGLSASSAIKQDSNSVPPEWDDVLAEAYEEMCNAERAVLEDQFLERTVSIETGSELSYQEYLQSAEWKQKRDLVLKRDGGVCQGCLKKDATEVHHFSYDDVPNEMMFDLISVCRECHERLHRKKIERMKKTKLAAQRAELEGEAQ